MFTLEDYVRCDNRVVPLKFKCLLRKSGNTTQKNGNQLNPGSFKVFYLWENQLNQMSDDEVLRWIKEKCEIF